jgi:16S rRNA G966 N2-methylase RsmD
MLRLIADLPNECVKMIIVEHMTALSLPDAIGAYKKIKSKKFGKTSLSYFNVE